MVHLKGQIEAGAVAEDGEVTLVGVADIQVVVMVLVMGTKAVVQARRRRSRLKRRMLVKSEQLWWCPRDESEGGTIQMTVLAPLVGAREVLDVTETGGGKTGRGMTAVEEGVDDDLPHHQKALVGVMKTSMGRSRGSLLACFRKPRNILASSYVAVLRR